MQDEATGVTSLAGETENLGAEAAQPTFVAVPADQALAAKKAPPFDGRGISAVLAGFCLG